MKNILTAFCVYLFLMLPITAIAAGVSFKPGESYYNFDGSDDLFEDAHAKSFGLEFLFGDRFGMELNYSKGDSNVAGSAVTGEFEHMCADMLFRLVDSDNTLVPYFVFGVGELQTEAGGVDDDEVLVNVGGGLQLNMTENFSLFFDVRALDSLNDDNVSSVASLGLAMTLGSTKKEVQPVIEEKEKTVEMPTKIVEATPPPVERTVVKPRVEKVTLGTILFGFDSIEVTEEYVQRLNNLAFLLNKNPSVKVVLEGHTDSKGDPEYNKNLAKLRGLAVKQALLPMLEVSEDRVTVTTMGETNPVADNDTAEGRSANRRVMVILTNL